MSRIVTVAELRRVLEAMRGEAPAGHAMHYGDVSLALAALPAEQEPSDSLLFDIHRSCVLPAEQSITDCPWHGTSLGSDCWRCANDQPAASEPSSAVPELPPKPTDITLAADLFPPTAVVRWDTYDALRTAAETLRGRLVAALRERDVAERLVVALTDSVNKAEAERDEARALAWEQAEYTLAEWEQCRVDCGEALLERDAAISRAEQAEAERDELRAQIERAQRRQEPLAWRCRIHSVTVRPACTDYRPGHDPECLPLYAAPVPADTAQQIAAAEQRGRAAAFEEVAAKYEWLPNLDGNDAAAWCRERVAEARG